MGEAERWDERWVIGPGRLRERLGQPGLRVVDARPAADYVAGHIPGALHADLYSPTFKSPDSSPAGMRAFDARLQHELRRLGVRPGETVVFYEEIAGTSAARGVWMLDYAGVGGGAILDGGLAAWVAAGGPLSAEPSTAEPSDVEVRPDPSTVISADEIAARLRDADAPLVVDTRGLPERAAGAVPGSVHLEWVGHLRPDGSLRGPDELRRAYAAVGVSAETAPEVVTYCASGYRAAHTWLVLRALGLPTVRNYAASWNEWGTRPDLPTERPGDRA